MVRPAIHGGDRVARAEHYGVDPSAVLDFSANIDPCGPPSAVCDILANAARHPRRLSSYPSQRAYADACVAIAAAEKCDPAGIVLGPGGAALIDVAVRALDSELVTVPVPAFSEYERAIGAAGKTMRACLLPGDLRYDPVDLAATVARDTALLINTPHNPSGIALSRDQVEATMDACAERGIDLVVDEAFADYVPEQSVVGSVQRLNAVTVVRSLTKFYALAGVRIGYAVTSPARAQILRAMLPSWPVGTLELEIARACVEDRSYAEKTRARNTAERAALVTALRDIGIRVFPSLANFLLLELPCVSHVLDDVLADLAREHRVLVRDCRSYRGLEERAVVRVAVMRSDANRRLAGALEAVLARR